MTKNPARVIELANRELLIPGGGDVAGDDPATFVVECPVDDRIDREREGGVGPGLDLL